jgi:hypothetical protein
VPSAEPRGGARHSGAFSRLPDRPASADEPSWSRQLRPTERRREAGRIGIISFWLLRCDGGEAMKRRALLLVVAVTAGAVFLPGAAAAPTPDLASLSSQRISAGVQYTKYLWRHSTAAIYVARIMSNSSSASLKVMSAHNVTGGGLETVRSMCARTPGCVAAVNGDFWDVAHPNAAALGGMVLRGEMWKSPNRRIPARSRSR